ncbi:hypothetical protein B0H10DRAFT_2033323 [Mycena sp. CBHHK59/15]|nr:hypothetical protein B0H10DRAFT_2033323 [Mycena sp. CBHHK59/15]
MEQPREPRGSKHDADASAASLSTHTNTHDLPRKPPREKRKREPFPVAPEDKHVLTPWLALLPPTTPTSTDQRLHEEIVAYVSYVKPTAQEMTARRTLLDVIQRTLRRRFPDGELKVFGSAATGLCLPTGDMDIAVMTREVIPPTEKKRPLFQMSTILKAARITWDVQVNFRAKVPIVTFQSLPDYGSFNVDIGINNADGPRAIEVVNAYLAKMPALRSLILVVKAFLAQRNLNNAAHGGLGSYAVTCMCISFLQLNPSKRPQAYIDAPMESDSLGALLTDFMFYYGIEFPYATSYISVTEGKLLPKASAPWITNKVPDGLAIQCLITPDNDVGKSAGRLEAIRSAFKAGYAAILKLSLTDASLLGPLVSLNQSTLDHRAHIRDIVDSGRLEAAAAPRNAAPRHAPSRQNTYIHHPIAQFTQARHPPAPPPNFQLPRRPPPAPVPEHVLTAWRGGSVNRKGSGFASGMTADALYVPAVAVHSHPRFDPEWPPRRKERDRDGRKRRRVEG